MTYLKTDFLSKTGIDVKYSTRTMKWFDDELPLRDPSNITDKEILAMAGVLEMQQEMELFDLDWYDPVCHAIKILEAQYEKVSTNEVVDQLEHLNFQQEEDLKAVLKDYGKQFDGTLGVYPHRKFHIN